MAVFDDHSHHPSEDVHTPPHAGCGHPDRWHAPDGDSTECEVSELVGALVRALQPGLVVETGTAYGHTTRQIARALTANRYGRLVSLEVDTDRIAHAEQLIASDVKGGLVDVARFEIRCQSSLDYTPDEPIGFAWFDSLYELRARELLHYRALGCLPAGTIVGFHDTTSGLRGHYMDVRAEVERLASDRVLRPIFLPTPRGVGLAQIL